MGGFFFQFPAGIKDVCQGVWEGGRESIQKKSCKIDEIDFSFGFLGRRGPKLDGEGGRKGVILLKQIKAS